jgi:esterase/lipase
MQGILILLSHLTRPRNRISAGAVSMSGVFALAVALNLASHGAVKIPDIRIELCSKRIPGTREERFLAQN